MKITNLLKVLGLVGLSGCAARLSQVEIDAIMKKNAPFRAKREYEQHPDWKKEIALYNIEGILKDNCRSAYTVTEEGFSCKMAAYCRKSKKVQMYSAPAGPNRYPTVSYNTCLDEFPGLDVTFRWADISSVDASLGDIMINGKSIPLRDSKQAEELKEALEYKIK
ncbi:MAG: hypothetical protein ABIA37_02510 [Candidatus Woesearchaeota archaeon]